MSELGNKEVMARNIERYMKAHNETRKELSEILDVPYTTVSNWLKGNTYPRIDKIELMAKHWDVKKSDLIESKSISEKYIDAYDLILEHDNEHPGSELPDILKLVDLSGLPKVKENRETLLARQLAPAELVKIAYNLNETGNKALIAHGHLLELDKSNLLTEKERRFRLAQEAGAINNHDAPEPVRTIRHYLAPAAAGYANPVEGSDYEDIPLPPGAPDWADFSIDISGDSMEPYIKDGSTIYVERDVSLQDFDVGVFYLDGDIFIKQFAPSYDGSVYLLSANPRREDANKFISKDSNSTLICYGKAILPRKLPAPEYV